MAFLKKYRKQLLAISFSIIGCLLFFQVVMDDAFIAFRYGYNLVNYGIWNFHPNNSRIVEGYTTFIYTVLSIIPAFLHINPYLFIKIIGLLLFISIILKIYYSTENKPIAWLAILVFTANWQTYVHVYSGIETLLWFYLLLQLMFLLNKEITSRKQHIIWFICLLLPLTRPEGIIISFAVFLFLKFIKKIKINYYLLGLYFGLGLVYFASRYYYFGMLFPLPFYQKSVKNNAGIINLIINSISALHYIICVILFSIILHKEKYFKWLVWFSLILFFGIYGTTLLTMNFADRFSYQLFFPLVLFGIILSANTTPIEKIKIKHLSVFLVIFVFAKGIYSQHAKDFSSLGDNLFSGYYYSRTHLNLALQFRKLNHPELKVFCNEAGIFPYYANVEYYDPEGLTDKYLSDKIIDEKYIEKINPDAILYLIGVPETDASSWINNLPSNHPLHYYKYILNNDNYDKIGYVVCVEQNVYIGIAVNKNSKYYTEINSAGKNAIFDAKNNELRIKKFLKLKYYKTFPIL